MYSSSVCFPNFHRLQTRHLDQQLTHPSVSIQVPKERTCVYSYCLPTISPSTHVYSHQQTPWAIPCSFLALDHRRPIGHILTSLPRPASDHPSLPLPRPPFPSPHNLTHTVIGALDYELKISWQHTYPRCDKNNKPCLRFSLSLSLFCPLVDVTHHLPTQLVTPPDQHAGHIPPSPSLQSK